MKNIKIKQPQLETSLHSIYNTSENKDEIGCLKITDSGYNKYRYSVDLSLIDGWYFQNTDKKQIYKFFYQDGWHDKQHTISRLPTQHISARYASINTAININEKIKIFITTFPFTQQETWDSYSVIDDEEEFTILEQIYIEEKITESMKVMTKYEREIFGNMFTMLADKDELSKFFKTPRLNNKEIYNNSVAYYLNMPNITTEFLEANPNEQLILESFQEATIFANVSGKQNRYSIRKKLRHMGYIGWSVSSKYLRCELQDSKLI